MQRSFLMPRRAFLASSSMAAAGAMLTPRRTPDRAGPDILVPRGGRWADPDWQALTAAALEAARAAGAAYADVRLARRLREQWTGVPPIQPDQHVELHGVGVRVLVDGYWGFLGSAVWSTDEMARLARGAVMQAKATGLGKHRTLPLAPAGPPVTGEWVMPVTYDPFTISYGEKYDFFNHVTGILHRTSPLVGGVLTANFQRTESVFASSEGSSWAQTTFLTDGTLSTYYASQLGYGKFSEGWTMSPRLSPAGKGWEQVCDPQLLDTLPAMIDLSEQARNVVPVNVGRYDVVCGPYAAAAILNTSIGAATELDRALGYEANASGTSYLDQPLEMLGRYTVGSPLLHVSANRTQPGGAATVKWDDEGIAPEPFTIVKDGILTDYQTTREQAAWLAPYYQKIGRPVRSHGCACAGFASQVTMQNPPNLQLMPGAAETTFEDLVAGTDKGIALLDVSNIIMDVQQLNGTVFGTMREINKGKLGAFIMGGAFEFRAPNFWKSLDGIGGPSSTRWLGLLSSKGEPMQLTAHSVGAVPIRVRNIATIDVVQRR